MNKAKKRGFTLVELLVVIAIIAILAAILFPVFVRAKESGKITRCAANLKQIAGALSLYADDNNGRLPDGPGLTYGRVWYLIENNPPVQGPYMQDLLYRYVRSNNVWLCPSLRPDQRIPYCRFEARLQAYKYSDNRGSTAKCRNAASNYMWIHYRARYTGAGPSGYEPVKAAGQLVSAMKSPSKVIVFLEFPYWTPSPHKVNDDAKGGEVRTGTNLAFYDGHVKLVSDTNWAYTCAGWEW